MKDSVVKISKFLSYVLRHQPQSIGIELDAQGWVGVDELLAKANAHGQRFDETLLKEVVASNDKQRFVLDETQRRIRANQGHSVNIDLALAPIEPPEFLYHGTATRFVESIRQQGLLPRQRQHVHLSAEVATAHNVGERHGKPVILRVRALALAQSGQAFYRSENGVWLTEQVPVAFIEFPAD